MKDIFIIGAGGHGKVVLDIIKKSEKYYSIAFLDDNSKIHGNKINDIPVIGSKEKAIDNKKLVIIAIGNNKIRKKVFTYMLNENIEIINAIHPSAIINSLVEIGKGNVITAGVVINSNTKIKDNTIINTGSTVDHDCLIESHVHISPGVNLGGDVKIREGAHIGIGVSIIPGVEIGENTIIGAGATVINDIPENCTAVGTPAKPIKKETQK